MSSNNFSGGGSRRGLLSVRQVAELLGVSTATVYRLCERGELAYFRLTHTIRVRIVDLAQFLEAHLER